MPLTYSPEHLSTRDRAGRRLSLLVGSDPWVQRDSGAVPRRAHNPEVPGANPGPATPEEGPLSNARNSGAWHGGS